MMNNQKQAYLIAIRTPPVLPDHYIIGGRHVSTGPKSKYRFILYYFNDIMRFDDKMELKEVEDICKHFKNIYHVFRSHTDSQVWEMILKSLWYWAAHLKRDEMNKTFTDFETIISFK